MQHRRQHRVRVRPARRPNPAGSVPFEPGVPVRHGLKVAAMSAPPRALLQQRAPSAAQPGALLLFGLAVLAATAACAARDIYVCRHADVTHYSDRPCDATLRRAPLDAGRLTIYSAPAVPPQPARARPQREPRAHAAQAPRRSRDVQQQCAALAARIARLDSRMRAGYRAARGAKLHAERHELTARRYALRCSRQTGWAGERGFNTETQTARRKRGIREISEERRAGGRRGSGPGG